MFEQLKRWGGSLAVSAAALALACGTAPAQTPSGEPIKIGFGMSLTGPLAANGKSSLLAMKIWEEDTNAKGGLLGRPVKLVYYDDQSSPAAVPAIYSKLLDVDKVDLIVSGYASTQIAAAMPVAISKKKLFISLFGTGINDEFRYDRYFSMIPNGPTPKPAFTRGFFKVAEAQNPKPQTIAIAMADAEFGRNACEGAAENAKAAGFKIVYNRSYPPATTDFTPIVRAVQAANPDLFVVCSYPLDSVGMVKAMHEVGFKPKMWGGAMVGLQATVFKTQLGPLLNGLVNFETWLPHKTMEFPGSLELLKKYQARAKAEGVDPLGYYMPVWAYAYLQVLGDAVNATKSLDDAKLADYIRKNPFKTTVGDVKFGKGGEWAVERVMAAQFQNVKSNSIEEFRKLDTLPIIYPPQYKSGEVIYPYEKATAK
ncbi:MAG: amino acid ABC transporter substrate-binding protein [Pseudorhodoplanes sp.]|jgi:branched-chain amino acid transport system substrate-binding protein|nr:amino acid ABC transporter substrate-binding protein [Pseudorhodoplanes sp.]